MDIFKQIKLNLRFIKFQRFLGSLLYSLQRDQLERQVYNFQNLELIEKPGKLLRVEPTARGSYFYFEKAELEICFLSPDLVRVDWKPGKPPVPYGIYRQDWSEVETTLDKTANGCIVSSSTLKVAIATDGSLEIQNSTGEILRQELPPQRQGEAWVHQAQLRTEEHIYGLGERAAPLNLRSQPGKVYKMWNYDAGGKYGPGTDPLYLCIPVYLGLHSCGKYLVFYENTHRATFSFAENATASFEGGALRYYLTSGSPAQMLERYTELTGRPPLPPRWALGYHQLRWGYETEDKVRKTAQGFQIHDLPLSAIHLDIDVQVNFRAFTIDPNRFPQLASFTQELAAMGVPFIAINNPGIKYTHHSNLFLEGQVLNAFCTLPNGKPAIATVWPSRCVFPDFTNSLVRKWWSRQYQYLLDVGVAGFWHDMNEPGVFTLWGDATLPLPTRHSLEGRGGNHLEAHNIYGLMQAKAGYESLREYRPQQRPFIVSRSGWAGLQRYAWTWTGDVETSWAGLQQTIPTILGMSLSGIPYTGPDIGGFKGNPTAELYLRWFQMASFLTFCRTHSADNVKHRNPWSFGEPTLSIVRDFLRLRYRLIPYFYTLAWEATQTGHSPVRPLFWFNSDDSRLWSVDDAFFLGDALLVYPVVEAGARSRQIILPKGCWYNFWDDAAFQGPDQVNIDAPLEQIPLPVRAGSILPMEVEQQLIFHIYPPVQGGTSIACLYSDAGDGYGEWRLEQFRMMREENALELTWEQQGNYAFPYQNIQLHLHGIEPQQVWVDGQKVACQGQRLECIQFQQIRFEGNWG